PNRPSQLDRRCRCVDPLRPPPICASLKEHSLTLGCRGENTPERAICARLRMTIQSGTDVTTHPALAEAIAALSDSGYWALALDTRWRVVAETAEQAAVMTGGTGINGTFYFGPEGLAWDGTGEMPRESIRQMGGWMLSDLDVDRHALSTLLHPALR